MSGKVMVTIDDLKALAKLAIDNGKTDIFVDIALQWAEEADKEIARLNTLINKLISDTE
jgi:hypothetical protein